jgi:hypothetical protein
MNHTNKHEQKRSLPFVRFVVKLFYVPIAA